MMNRRLFLILGLILVCSLSAWGQSWISATHLVAPIEVRVDTLHGFFEVGHRDGRQLTAMYPNPSFGGSDIFGFYLDGTIYRSSFWGGGALCDQNMDDYYLNTIYIPAENTIVSTWQVPSIGGNIVVRQKLTPVVLDSLGTIKIQYFIQNNSIITHSIGIALKLDVKIQYRDNAPFAVGVLFTPDGVAYAYPSIPQYWQAFLTSPTDTSHSNLIARGIVNLYGATPPDSFVLGEAAEFYGPGTGIKTPCWNIDRTHIGQPYYDSGALVRWGPQSIDPGDEISFTTYYGFGSPPNTGEGLVITNLSPTTASISDCSYDTMSASVLITNNSSSAITSHNVEVCIDLGSSGLSIAGSNCVTLSPDSLIYLSSGNAAWQLVIPPGYSAGGNVVDTLIFVTHNDDSTLVINDYDTLIFTTPFFDGLPPSDTVVFPLPPYVKCDSSVFILLHDNDAGVDPSLTRISYYDRDGYEHNLSSSDLLFHSSGDTISLSISDTLITASSDTILLGDTVQFCITNLVDLYGCGISADECDTIFIDTEPPHITSIIPAPSSAMTSDSFTVRIFIEDNASGVDELYITFEVPGPGTHWEPISKTEWTVNDPGVNGYYNISYTFILDDYKDIPEFSLEEGVLYHMYIKAIDAQGNEVEVKAQKFVVDETGPVTDVSVDCTHAMPFNVTVYATDAHAGVHTVTLYFRYSAEEDGGGDRSWSEWMVYDTYEWTTYENATSHVFSFIWNPDDGYYKPGYYEFYAYAEDNLGNSNGIPTNETTAQAECYVEPIEEDFNGDGMVNVLDLYYIIANWGKNESSPDWATVQIYDLSGNGVIDALDIYALVAKWTG